jgi:hypothetical protein
LEPILIIMATCANIELIRESEYIGNSLPKINNNFEKLRQEACEVEDMLNKIVNVRTFFYYGPNAPINTTSGANDYSNDNASSRPSSSTIQNFINNEININDISEKDDIVYVIYQKTGWFSGKADIVRTGKGAVPYQATVQVPIYGGIGIRGGGGGLRIVGYATVVVTRYADYSWSRTLEDQYSFYTPNYVIYKLVFNGTQYVAEENAQWPKYVTSITNSINNWNDPKSWSTY